MSELKKMKVILLRHTPNPEETVSLAAKLCYSRSDIESLQEKISLKDQSAFIRKLMDMGHESVLEHVSFTFGIEGVSRVLLAQLTRHRIASFSVQSQRYVSYENGFGYIIPDSIRALGEDAVRKYHQQMETIESWYVEWQRQLGNLGEKSNEDARFVLPNACETRIVMTMNVRELLHFFSLRMCSRAQWEIRKMAEEMFLICFRTAPSLFLNAGPACLRGKCPEGDKSCGRAAEIRIKREKLTRSMSEEIENANK